MHGSTPTCRRRASRIRGGAQARRRSAAAAPTGARCRRPTPCWPARAYASGALRVAAAAAAHGGRHAATPVVRQIRFATAGGGLPGLPAAHLSAARRDAFLSRWLKLLRGEFGRIEESIDLLPRLADPELRAARSDRLAGAMVGNGAAVGRGRRAAPRSYRPGGAAVRAPRHARVDRASSSSCTPASARRSSRPSRRRVASGFWACRRGSTSIRGCAGLEPGRHGRARSAAARVRARARSAAQSWARAGRSLPVPARPAAVRRRGLSLLRRRGRLSRARTRRAGRAAPHRRPRKAGSYRLSAGRSSRPGLRVGFQSRIGIDAIVGDESPVRSSQASRVELTSPRPRRRSRRRRALGRPAYSQIGAKIMNPHDNAEALLRELRRTAPQPVLLRQADGRSALPHGAGLRTPQADAAQSADTRQGRAVRIARGDRWPAPVVDPGVAIDGLGREIVVPVRSWSSRASGTVRGGCRGGTRGGSDAQADFFTLWVCYRECSADYQPVLVSDCDTREQCAAGTTVETLLLQGHAGTCAAAGRPALVPSATRFAAARRSSPDGVTRSCPAASASRRTRAHRAAQDRLARPAQPSPRAVRDVDAACEASKGDSCVPLAAVLMSDGVASAVDSCLVRPRIYSNAVLLDLILCLAQRVDECCKDAGRHPDAGRGDRFPESRQPGWRSRRGRSRVAALARSACRSTDAPTRSASGSANPSPRTRSARRRPVPTMRTSSGTTCSFCPKLGAEPPLRRRALSSNHRIPCASTWTRLTLFARTAAGLAERTVPDLLAGRTMRPRAGAR